MSTALYSVPLTEDHVHSLGQVVHSAVSRHRRVPLVAGPEGGEANTHNEAHPGKNSCHTTVGKQEALAV